jgi:hypothetical protein
MFKIGPHALPPTHKRHRIKLSEDFLKTLAVVRLDSWVNFLTGNERWFWLPADYKTIWPPGGEERPMREKKTVSTDKITGTIFCSLAWIHMNSKLPKGEWLNSHYFGQSVLYGVDANLRPAGTAKPILIHMDKPSPHRSKEMLTYMKDFIFHPAPDPAFSPNLVPLTFYFFGTINARSRGRSFQDADELVQAVRKEACFEIQRIAHWISKLWRLTTKPHRIARRLSWLRYC